MAAFTQFYPLVEPWVPGCPRPLVLQQLYAVLQDFLSFSQIWQEDILTANVTSAQLPLTVAAPAGTRVLQIRKVRSQNLSTGNDAMLHPKTRDALRQWAPDWETLTGQDPYWFYTTGQSTFSVVPMPSGTLQLTATCALTIAQDGTATTMPDELFYEYSDGIAKGVIGRLLFMPNKAWSMPQSAATYEGGYAATRRRAKATADQDFNNGPIQVDLHRRF